MLRLALLICLFAVPAHASTMSAGPARPVTMTFDGLGEVLGSYSENGILAEGGWMAELTPGHIHVDAGGPYTEAIRFSTGYRFDIQLIEFGHYTPHYSIWSPLPNMDPWNGTYIGIAAYNNVGLYGYRGADLVASYEFGLSADRTVIHPGDLGRNFTDLDSLLIWHLFPPFIGMRDGLFYGCDDSPCGHMELDTVSLRPTRPIPLPSGFGLLAASLLMLPLVARRRPMASSPMASRPQDFGAI